MKTFHVFPDLAHFLSFRLCFHLFLLKMYFKDVFSGDTPPEDILSEDTHPEHSRKISVNTSTNVILFFSFSGSSGFQAPFFDFIIARRFSGLKFSKRSCVRC